MKMTDRLNALQVLHAKGLELQEIADLLKMNDVKQINTYLIEQKIQKGERVDISQYSSFETDVLKKAGILEKVKEKIGNQVTENSILNILQSDYTKESESTEKVTTKQSKANATATKYESEVARIKKLMKEEDIDLTCSVCKNQGTINLVKKTGLGMNILKCPKCKGQSRKNKDIKLRLETEEELLAEMIPSLMYRKKEFSAEKLERTIPLPEDLKKAIDLNDYIETLTDLLLDFKNGKLPKNSYLLTAPDSFGKKFFIYQVMKEVLKHNMNPSKLLDILELNTLLRKYDTDKLDELLDKDIVFVDLVGSPSILNTDIYNYILNYCSKKGIPSIFISRKESEVIIQNRAKSSEYNVNWSDLFTTNKIDYDYAHLLEIGITGNKARLVYTYKKKEIEERIRFSPMKKVNSSYFGGDEFNTSTQELERILDEHSKNQEVAVDIDM